jgi:steroid delta-isomerase-like uncharacterized protein
MKRIFVMISIVWIGLIAQGCEERGGNQSATNSSDEAVVLRFMELMDSHQFDRLEEVLGQNVEFHLGNYTLNRDEIIALIKSFYEAFPDFTHTPEEIYSVDGRVIMRATDRATHLGEFQGIPASGRKIEVGQIAIYRVEGGRIVEVQEQFDTAGLMEQIQAPGATE